MIGFAVLSDPIAHDQSACLSLSLPPSPSLRASGIKIVKHSCFLILSRPTVSRYRMKTCADWSNLWGRRRQCKGGDFTAVGKRARPLAPFPLFPSFGPCPGGVSRVVSAWPGWRTRSVITLRSCQPLTTASPEAISFINHAVCVFACSSLSLQKPTRARLLLLFLASVNFNC